MVNKINFKTAISIMFIAVFYTQNSNAQRTNNLFMDYHKWGILVQLNTFDGSKDVIPINNSNLSYELIKHKRFAVGLTYNFYQSKKWNFRADIKLQWFGDDDFLFIDQEETILPFDFNTITSTENEIVAHLPITAEYLLVSKGRFNLSLGAGLGISYWEFQDLETLTIRVGSQDAPKQTIFSATQTNSKTPFYASGQLEANLYFKTCGFLLKTSIIYNKSFKTYRTGTYEFTNLQVSPDTSGSIKQSGDFVGVSLSVFFRKGKKKN